MPTPARRRTSTVCGECRAEVVAQRQARAALRAAGGPCLPSSLLRSLRSIPVETELPPMPPGLGVTADGQFVLLRDVPRADPGAGPAAHEHHIHTSACPALPGRPRRPGPVAAPRRFSRRARIGAVSGLALSALAVGALAAPGGTPEPVPPSGVLGGVVLELPPRLSPPSSGRPRPRHHGGRRRRPAPWRARRSSTRQLRDRLNRIPAAFHPDPEHGHSRSAGCVRPIGYADFTAAAAG